MILTFNGKFMSRGLNKVLGYESTPPTPDPYNPLNLPANTVRVRTSDGNAPTKGYSASYETATLVTGTNDVYDVYKSGTSFSDLLHNSTNVIEVLGANTAGITNMANMFQFTAITTVPLFDTSGVTNMSFMFGNCGSLTTVPLFDTSKVTNMEYMFISSALTIIPLFDTSKVTNMDSAFGYSVNVSSGALALYQQASTQAVPPSSHNDTFSGCGISTTTGAAELAQIPSSWGGQGS